MTFILVQVHYGSPSFLCTCLRDYIWCVSSSEQWYQIKFSFWCGNPYQTTSIVETEYNCQNKPHMNFITCKCKCKCCGSILSLVRFLFSFVNINRIAKFPLAKNADLVTQSFMSSHDNVKKQIMVKFHITDICACSHTLKSNSLYESNKVGNEKFWPALP